MDDFVWIFNGAKGRFPGGVFRLRDQAESWIAEHSLTGVLTRYPVDVGSYDWAVKNGHIKPKDEHDSNFIGSFSSASFEHHHYENGLRD
ncbi:hypothetical protein [Prosthecobacter sp.]|uniref:DUF7710 domain-containing protein n=1 Tax=Prosthecobacter sp. TaxID=1965333 RepID=UPI0037844169